MKHEHIKWRGKTWSMFSHRHSIQLSVVETHHHPSTVLWETQLSHHESKSQTLHKEDEEEIDDLIGLFAACSCHLLRDSRLFNVIKVIDVATWLKTRPACIHWTGPFTVVSLLFSAHFLSDRYLITAEYLCLRYTGSNSQTTNWTETAMLAGIKSSSGLLRSGSVGPSSSGSGTFLSVTAFVSFGVNILKSTGGKTQCIAPPVRLAAKGKHTVGGVAMWVWDEDICVDDWALAVWFRASTNPEFSLQAAVTSSSPTETLRHRKGKCFQSDFTLLIATDSPERQSLTHVVWTVLNSSGEPSVSKYNKYLEGGFRVNVYKNPFHLNKKAEYFTHCKHHVQLQTETHGQNIFCKILD